MKLYKNILSTLALGLILSNPVNAAIVNVNWSGTITTSPLAGLIDVGDTITGDFSYDDASSVLFSSPSLATYNTNHVSSFSVGGFSGSTTQNRIIVSDNNSGIGDQFDSRDTDINTTTGYTGDLISGFSVAQIFIVFGDPTATALSSVDLPSTLNSADFDPNYIIGPRIDLLNGLNSTNIYFRVDSFVFSSSNPEPPTTDVPETPTLLLLGAAFLGLVARKFKFA